MAVQNALFLRLDGLPHPGVFIAAGLAESALPVQGVLGRLHDKIT
jgi:hypothetical protein